jgi:hypothetical protein
MSLHLAKPLPKGTEYLADVAEALAKQHKISPYLILGILYAESNFGLALKPSGPAGSGDFIAREAKPERDERMAKFPLPGVVRKHLPEGIKARGISTPVDAWVPTTNGWGCGLFQVDYEAHFDFCKSGDWKDPMKAGTYVITKILQPNRPTLLKKVPGLSGVELEHAIIASYNAGAGRVAKFLIDGKGLDKATFHPGYHTKIANKADELAGMSGAFMLHG